MPLRRLNSNLLKKLAVKVGKSEKYIREQIRKKASKYQISSEAYFVHWLDFKRIGAENYRRSLSPEIQNEIRDLQNNLNSRDKSSLKLNKGRSTRVVAKIIQIKRLKINPKPDILPKLLVAQALENSESYPVLFIFENSLRNLICSILGKKYGHNWWKEKVNKKIRSDVAKRIQEERSNPWRGSRGPEPIFYTDFSNLATILRSNAIDFEPIFKGITGGLSFLTRRLDELNGVRHNIAHTNPLKAIDRELMNLYFKNFYDLLDILNKRINNL